MKSIKDLILAHGEGKISRIGDTVCLSVSGGEDITRKASFSVDMSGISSEYLRVTYSALGLWRGKAYRNPFICLTDEDGNSVPLIANDDLSLDARKYTVTARIPEGSYKSLTVTLSVERARLCELRLYSLDALSEDELPPSLSEYEAKVLDNVTRIDISNLFNTEYDPLAESVSIGGGRGFKGEEINAHGIPFKVSVTRLNAVSFPPPPAENEELIDNFGVKARRKICRPVSRNSEIRIPIGRRISEIYFILGMMGERYQRYTFATEGTILGKYGREVTMPLTVDDVEGFYVETVYRDGRRDTALPKNLTEDRFTVSGDLSVYAVGCEPGVVEEIILHNKKLDTDFPLLALSVCEGERGHFPELNIPEKCEKRTRVEKNEKSIVLDGSILRLRSGNATAIVSTRGAPSVLSMSGECSERLKIRSESIVRFRHAGSEEDMLPTVREVFVSGDYAKIIMESGAFSFALTLSVAESDRILLSLRVRNESPCDERIGIIFPALDSIISDSSDDLYYFVPKYQNLHSNETAVIREESSPSFPMQFLSVYSEADGAGLGLLTRERDTRVRVYHLEKRDGVVSTSVEYPDMYGVIKSGETVSLSDTVLLLSDGDYHSVFDEYRRWLRGWYEPYKCQNKKWYRECFWLLAEITDFFETGEHVRFPIWHELSSGKFNFLDILEEQKGISGDYPDILHMWHWTVRYDENLKKKVRWGNYGGEDYELYGGLPRLKAALDEVRKMGVYTSMYMHPTLFDKNYPDFKKYEKYKVVDGDGKNITLADSYRMCHANAEWRDYAISKYPRVYSELSVPILYVDEFSLRIENRCYSDSHGHETPSNLLKTDREFISRLKDSVPEELVLYGEYAAVDINARYIDCNISYGFLDSISEMVERSWHSSDRGGILGRVMTDAYRFAFPKIVQLVLPMALRNLSWHPHKFIFWNGEAEYDSLWDVLETDGNDFTVKAYRIKKAYSDCFSSDDPEMDVESESPAIVINKFPSENRCVYTLYNRAKRTYRGRVLRIPHTEGAVYRDVWNGRMIMPELCDGFATISLDIGAQAVGCIAVSYENA